MLAAAFAQARTPRLYLQCRYKSTLSAINRTLDRSIRQSRRRSLDDQDDKTSHTTDRYKTSNTTDRYKTSHTPDRYKSFQSPDDYPKQISSDADENPPMTEAEQQNILNVPFTHKHHFTAENWDRLMVALKQVEERYIEALPTRPSKLPVYDKNQPGSSLQVKRELKKTFKADFAAIEPTLVRQQKDWLSVVMHLKTALRNAKMGYIHIPNRPWFCEGDPKSAQKAITFLNPPSSTSTQDADLTSALEKVSVLNQGMRSGLITDLVNKFSRAIVAGKDVKTAGSDAPNSSVKGMEKDQDHLSAGALGFGKLSKYEKTKAREEDERRKLDVSRELRERRKLEEESRLDDQQLASLVSKGRELQDENKIKYKVIQAPRIAKYTDDRPAPQVNDRDRDVYVSIPYTTAASEFLYGLNTVMAALKARRRKVYKLYVHPRALSSDDTKRTLRDLCRSNNIRWTDVDDYFLVTMDKMAQGRPHNGIILEASPLPVLPVAALRKLDITATSIPIQLSEQSQEDAKINGTPSSIPAYYSHTWRKPLVLLLDGILDPGNLGNILRTAHFYGVDAVAICTNTCAPVNLPTVQKAASGAAEALTILSISTPANFVTTCKKNGWLIHAAVAPQASSASATDTAKKYLFTNTMTSPLARGSSLLMIGAEGQGLRVNLATKADVNVGVRGVKAPVPELDVGVDSLNVASSVAVLLEAFLRRPHNLEDVVQGTVREEDIVARII
jgi:21S rRNA (GM2251-2'-O)-methyltransferase